MFIDQNAARSPRHPLEPVFLALRAEQQQQQPGVVELPEVDVVTDRNNVRKLLRFVQGGASADRPFDIKVEAVAGAKTALLTRVEPRTRETISRFVGFGHNFEKAYTKAPPASTGHHRIVGYSFAGMRFVVRHEVDGYIGGGSGGGGGVGLSASAARGPSGAHPSGSSTGVGGLSDIMGSLSLDNKAGADAGAVRVESGGRAVPPSSILEIKTRAATKMLDMTEVLPQLWISQTPNLIVGYHHHGVFGNIQTRDMRQEIQKWEVANQGTLRKLACLIKKITAAASESPHHCALVSYTGGTSLKVLSAKLEPALPKSLYSAWDVKPQEKPQAEAAATNQITPPATPVAKAPTAESTTPQGDDKKGGAGPATSASSTSPSPQSGAAAAEPDDGALPVAELIDYGVQNGLGHLFARMPAELSAYRAVCAGLDARAVDVLGGRDLHGVVAELHRAGEEGETAWPGDVPPLDSAFRIVYSLLQDRFGVGAVAQAKAYKCVLFIVSSHGRFEHRAREMARLAFESRYQLSVEQRRALDTFKTKGPAEEV